MRFAGVEITESGFNVATVQVSGDNVVFAVNIVPVTCKNWGSAEDVLVRFSRGIAQVLRLLPLEVPVIIGVPTSRFAYETFKDKDLQGVLWLLMAAFKKGSRNDFTLARKAQLFEFMTGQANAGVDLFMREVGRRYSVDLHAGQYQEAKAIAYAALCAEFYSAHVETIELTEKEIQFMDKAVVAVGDFNERAEV